MRAPRQILLACAVALAAGSSACKPANADSVVLSGSAGGATLSVYAEASADGAIILKTSNPTAQPILNIFNISAGLKPYTQTFNPVNGATVAGLKIGPVTFDTPSLPSCTDADPSVDASAVCSGTAPTSTGTSANTGTTAGPTGTATVSSVGTATAGNVSAGTTGATPTATVTAVAPRVYTAADFRPVVTLKSGMTCGANGGYTAKKWQKSFDLSLGATADALDAVDHVAYDIDPMYPDNKVPVSTRGSGFATTTGYLTVASGWSMQHTVITLKSGQTVDAGSAPIVWTNDDATKPTGGTCP